MKINREELILALSKKEKILVYSFGTTPSMGFGADYLSLLNKVMTCLVHGVGFRLGEIKKPQGFITKLGWNDYFEPFCGIVKAPLLDFVNRGQFPYAKKFPLIKPLARLWLTTLTSPRSHYFNFVTPGPIDKLGPPIFHPNEDFLIARRHLVRMLWIYNKETVEEVNLIKQEIEAGDSYAAICIRRGDKYTEHPYVGIRNYIDFLDSLGGNWQKLFIGTDDITVVQEIAAAMPGTECVSLTELSSKGYVNTDFRALSASERRRRTIRFFAQLEMMRDASIFLGSKTTNVSWLVNAHRGGERVLWVD